MTTASHDTSNLKYMHQRLIWGFLLTGPPDRHRHVEKLWKTSPSGCLYTQLRVNGNPLITLRKGP